MREQEKSVRNRWLFLIVMVLFLVGFSEAQKLYINEFLASNVTINAEIIDFDDYSDWIEIYNDENQSIDLSGYYLTDDLNNPTKSQIPAGTIINGKGYLLFWADGMTEADITNPLINLHLSFKLGRSGEEIGLYDPQFNKIDSVVFGEQIPDVSFGRTPEDSSIWNYYGEPTPGLPNNTLGTLNTDFASEPIFSVQSGIFTGSKKVVLSSSSPTATIRFTVDGRRPTSSSSEFTSELTIGSTRVLRARAFDGDLLPSEIITQSYIVNDPTSLPIISIAAFPETLFDTQIGIYTHSIKGREVPVNIQYFDTGNTPDFALNTSLRVSGQAAWYFEPKPLTISVEDRFGSEEINHKIFSTRENDSFKSLYLRNSGFPDASLTYFRDGLQQSMVINQFDLDLQAYQPATTFINGEYWGIYNIREKLDADYIASHHPIDPTNIDYLEYDFDETPVVIEGDRADYYEFLNFLATRKSQTDENYKYIKTQVDVNEYLNYMITQIFCDNQNYLYTNVRWWREKVENAKWRWVMLDLDYGFGTVAGYQNDAIKVATDSIGTSGPWETFLFRKMLEYPEFKNEFIQRFAVYLNTVFHKERVIQLVDSLENNINSDISRHINKWRDIPSLNVWHQNVAILKDFALNRQTYQWQHINDFFELDGTTELSVHISEPSSGKIKLHNFTVPADYSGPHFKNVPINLKAIPAVGYRFVEWQGFSTSDSNSIKITLTDTSSITAIFERTDEIILPTVLQTDTTLTVGGSPYLAKGDLFVSEGATLTIEEGVEIQMTDKSNIFIHGNLTVNGSQSNPVVIKSNTNSGSSKWGVLCLENTTAPSIISHLEIRGATKGSDAVKHVGAISAHNSTIYMDNIRIEDALFPVYAQYSKVEISNSILHSDYTSDLINIKYADSALVENCDLRGNISYDTDAIDYDGINNGIIRGNTIYNFFGENSDGIDLGEGAKNILIENNLIFNCTDKGISVGQAATTIIKNNVIVNCAQGVGIKDDSSYAYIDRNTFYGNAYAVASFEKNLGAGGGNVDIVNSILSKSTIAPFFLDELSLLNVSYSLSDTKEMPGVGNLFTNPLFSNNFYLMENSPAIDSGDPSSSTDPDGSTADLGAYYFDGLDHINVLITEIHYNPANGDDYEFIELYNAGQSSINLSGYKLTGGISFTFPAGSEIANGEYLIIANNADTYSNNGYQVYGWVGNPLPNDFGADIRLLSDTDQVIDIISYIEGGTPGQQNSIQIIEDLYINEIQAINNTIIQDENGEYEDWIELYNGSDLPIDIGGLYITDDFTIPTKYQISNSNPDITTIKKGGFLLLWADQSMEQGLLHLDLKLNGNGEELAIVRVIENDTTFLDQISFGNQVEDVSYGRKPDGSDNWFSISLPTPNLPNTRKGVFYKGILVVNSLRSLEVEEIYDAFANNAFWGDYPISFWDNFPAPQGGYPSNLPFKPVGRGYVPFDVLEEYSTVIWLGNDIYNDNLKQMNSIDFFNYVDYGGNLILMTRAGREDFGEQLTQITGVNWVENESVNTNDCQAVYKGLQDISLIGNQSLNAVFDTALTNINSTLLFEETASFDGPRGLGVWHKPEVGGLYNPNGGQTVFISGRPYFYDYEELSSNVEFILEHMFGEIIVDINDSDIPEIIKNYELSQNYPNPFNPSTTIKYALKEKQHVELIVYDLLGRKVETLVDKKQNTGRYEVVFNAQNFSTGLYFVRIKAGTFERTRKMVLIK